MLERVWGSEAYRLGRREIIRAALAAVGPSPSPTRLKQLGGLSKVVQDQIAIASTPGLDDNLGSPMFPHTARRQLDREVGALRTEVQQRLAASGSTPARATVKKPRAVCGECFSYAFQFVREQGGVLKHGMVTHPWDKNDFWHAWVEKDGKIHDWQTAEVRKTEPVSIADFYAWWKPRDVRSYTADEAEVRAARAKHMGPW